MKRVKVNAQKIRHRLTTIMAKTGIPESDAEIVADSLIEAELEGRESHGLMRFPSLYERIACGKDFKNPHILFNSIGTNLFLVDGDNVLGAVLANHVMTFCADTAKKEGMSIAAVKNANHLGAAAYYTNKAAKDGLFAFLATNASPAVAPSGGMSKLLGTNPFSVSFPAGKYGVFSLDIATSASAMGKILMYAKEDKSIPIGWAMDENGQDTTSSSAAVDAFKKGIGILPMAGHKGMGLAMVIDVLAGLLSGASLSYQVSNSFAAGNVSGVGFFCLVLDIKRFMPLDEFQSKLETWFDILKADKVRTGTSGIFIPGEIEQNHAVSTGDSLDVLSSVIKDIEKIEAELGLEKQTTAI